MDVLFIDDDAEDVEIFSDVIRELRPDAACYSILNCSEIETEFRKIGTPDVIFLDGYMYPVSGKECLKRLKGLIDHSRTQLFVHSGSIGTQEAQEFLDQGVSGVLRKGANVNEIKATFENALSSLPS